MSDSLHIVCPNCTTSNRIPSAKLNKNPNCGKCHQALFMAQPLELTASNMPQHIQYNGIPLLVDFWAPWCGPCQMMAPAFEQAAIELEPKVRLAKVNTEMQQELGAQYAIRSIPTMIIFRQGKELARKSGAMSTSDIVNWIRSIS